MWAAAGEKKRRRRKQPPTAPGSPESIVTPEPMTSKEDDASGEDPDVDDDDEVDLSMLKDIANYKFDGEIGVSDTSKDSAPASDTLSLPLPDIKDTLRKKELEEEMARIEQEESSTRVKIKRNDRKAMAKVRVAPIQSLFICSANELSFLRRVQSLVAGTRSLCRCRRLFLRRGRVWNCKCSFG